ncbi:hypothetical protein AMBR_DPAELIID_02803 [Lacticaseibacillus rhamnosus]|nr:hypothetical protein AMBR_DPAELIID_02803 [Lacticaseibacillus rhamnosus]
MVLLLFLMIRRPPRSTQGVSSAASDVYKRQLWLRASRVTRIERVAQPLALYRQHPASITRSPPRDNYRGRVVQRAIDTWGPVSYTHLRAHETEADLVCRLLLEKKKKTTQTQDTSANY